jgi:putative phosphoesterase
MRLGVFGDVHGNLPALEAVLDRLDADAYVCTGDLVGYGPWPNECIARVRELGATTVAGNHDLIALGRLSDERCIPLARETLSWTRGALGAGARAWLERLPLRVDRDGLTLAHGSPDDPEEYVAHRADALRVLGSTTARTVVLGHTHRTLRVAQGSRLLLNPGAVGQSRERRAVARAAVLDAATNTVEELVVNYDVERTRAELRRLGLPDGGPHLRPSRARSIARALRARV